MNNRDVSLIDKKIYDTYYCKKNKEGLCYAIPLGLFCLILKEAIGLEILIWGIYALWCYSNNQKLRNNPKVIKERQYLIQYRQEVLEGKWDWVHEDAKKRGWE